MKGTTKFAFVLLIFAYLPNVPSTLASSISLQCSDDSMILFLEKSVFPEAQVTLLDQSCNDVKSSPEKFLITIKYNACGTITLEEKDHIIRTNKATIESTNLKHSYFQRINIYEYDLSCMFQRKHDLGTKGYKATVQRATTKISSSADFKISMAMYKSPDSSNC